MSSGTLNYSIPYHTTQDGLSSHVDYHAATGGGGDPVPPLAHAPEFPKVAHFTEVEFATLTQNESATWVCKLVHSDKMTQKTAVCSVRQRLKEEFQQSSVSSSAWNVFK